MIRNKWDVTLNSVRMSDLDPQLMILDISYGKISWKDTLNQLAGRDGVILANRYQEAITIKISFGLFILDRRKRQTAIQKVVDWARNGGTFRSITERPDHRLMNCVCTELPVIDSVAEYTKTLSVAFTAYAFPYWEAGTATVKTLSGKTASGKMTVPGNAPKAYISVTITAQQAITWVSVAVGGSVIRLEGISVPANGVIKIAYTTDRMISIKYGSKSLLANRTADSSDMLTGVCGQDNDISVSASGKIKTEFSTRGAWY